MDFKRCLYVGVKQWAWLCGLQIWGKNTQNIQIIQQKHSGLCMFLTMEGCLGWRASLCWGRALGARVEGWLSEALVQKRTKAPHTHTHRHTIISAPAKQIIQSQIELGKNDSYIKLCHIFTCLFRPCSRLCGCWICWPFLKNNKSTQSLMWWQLGMKNSSRTAGVKEFSHSSHISGSTCNRLGFNRLSHLRGG